MVLAESICELFRAFEVLLLPQGCPRGHDVRHEAVLLNYVQLTKPRSVLLLLVTALAGLIVARPEAPSLLLVSLTLAGGAMAAGGANALNCYLDRQLDLRMRRTASRPLPAGSIRPGRALAFGVALCAVASLLLGFGVNWLAAGLAMAGVLYYVLIYTWWLKPRSSWNVVIGGGAGAMPLLVGWVAATGQLSPWPFWMGAIVICWTPPHFWSLALVRRREYEEAGIPMLPVVRGEGETRRQIGLYSVLLLVVSLVLATTGFAGPVFLVTSLAMGLMLVIHVVELLYQATDEAAWRLYRFTILYLALLFGSLILDRAAGWAPMLWVG